tara:strand:- start:151 stop:255 length:105 start_codon:yes stop_codon:yes gene_type:complete
MVRTIPPHDRAMIDSAAVRKYTIFSSPRNVEMDK